MPLRLQSMLSPLSSTKKAFKTSGKVVQHIPTYKNVWSLLKSPNNNNNNKIKNTFLLSAVILGLLKCTFYFLFICHFR